MKVWLDDIRPMPEGYDIHCKTANHAICILATGEVTFLDFDHDLADIYNDIEETGYTVACFIEEMVYMKKIRCPEWAVHSANPVGEVNINMAMRAALRYEDKHL